MKTILFSATITALIFFSSCGGKNPGSSAGSNSSAASPETEASGSSGGGSISCKIDGKDWINNSASATQTGKSFLNIASDEDQKEAISIILDHPAAGSLNFNQGVSGSYTDATGKSYGSKDGSGTVVIASYTAPDHKINGSVTGTFGGTFSFDPANSHIVTDGKFNMPVKSLTP